MTFIHLVSLIAMVWLVWRRQLCYYFRCIFVTTTLSQTNRLMVLIILTITLWTGWGDHFLIDSLPLIKFNFLFFLLFSLLWCDWCGWGNYVMISLTYLLFTTLSTTNFICIAYTLPPQLLYFVEGTQ